MNDSITFAAVTTWISIADAKAKRAELIAQGIDKKQVKLSSYRWKNIKDHSEGYICRVLIVKGLRPELELADTKRVKKNKAAALFFLTRSRLVPTRLVSASSSSGRNPLTTSTRQI